MRPKDIGTRAEAAVVRYLAAHGWPLAERRALHGIHDLGDITGTPGLVWEVKGGEAAQDPSDKQVEAWLTEAEVERCHAGAAPVRIRLDHLASLLALRGWVDEL